MIEAMRLFVVCAALAAACAFFPSCSANIEGWVETGGGAELSLDIALSSGMGALIGSFSAMSGTAAGPVLDAAAIEWSLKATPGVDQAALENKGPAAIAGSLKISHIGDFLAAKTGAARFITFEEKAVGEKSSGRLLVSLDRAAGPGVLALLSEDARDYLSALMAPVATGEALSREEYLQLVASIYGRGIAGEIAAARVNAAVRFPGPVTAIQGGKAEGRRAVFAVPLLDLLVLDKPCNYAVEWGN